MYYEEKFINGKMCFRTKPTGSWTTFSQKELSRMYVQLAMKHRNLKYECDEKERQLNIREEQLKD
jgi:hypothetical protein